VEHPEALSKLLSGLSCTLLTFSAVFFQSWIDLDFPFGWCWFTSAGFFLPLLDSFSLLVLRNALSGFPPLLLLQEMIVFLGSLALVFLLLCISPFSLSNPCRIPYLDRTLCQLDIGPPYESPTQHSGSGFLPPSQPSFLSMRSSN